MGFRYVGWLMLVYSDNYLYLKFMLFELFLQSKCVVHTLKRHTP